LQKILAMEINFNLKDPNAEVSAVRLVISHKGKVYRKYIGISVRTDQWKRPKRGKQYSSNRQIAEKLKSIRLSLEESLNDLSPEWQVNESIDKALSENVNGYISKGNDYGKAPTFWEYVRIWENRPSSAIRQRKNSVNLIARLMGTKDNWNDITTAYYSRLITLMNNVGYSKNYEGSVIAKLKTIMSEGLKLKYHTNLDFNQFHKTTEQPDTVYLTKDEIDRIYNLEIKDEMHRRVRDLFLVGVYTAARFSDYSELSSNNVQNGRIVFVQHKTAGKVIIPLAPRVDEILRRYGGKVPKVCQVIFNRYIKDVCRDAGIDDNVSVTRSKGALHVTQILPKWKLVSSHTARRTGCTLLYMSGIPMRQIMLLSGHKSESSFLRYVRFTKEENAELLADNDFFK